MRAHDDEVHVRGGQVQPRRAGAEEAHGEARPDLLHNLARALLIPYCTPPLTVQLVSKRGAEWELSKKELKLEERREVDSVPCAFVS